MENEKELTNVKELDSRTFTDEELDAKIDEALAAPGIDEMLENVAEGLAQDLTENSSGDPVVIALKLLVDRQEAFEKRVAATFKHAGFKF